jgi:uncharacterized protein
MFRPMRRKNKEISREAAEQLLLRSRRGVLAVNGDDGYPYAVPINYFYDADSRKIYFHGARAGHKYESIRACGKVCFTVYGNETVREDEWAPFLQSVVVFGICRPIEDDTACTACPAGIALLKKLAMKYYPSEQLVDDEIRRAGKAAQIFEIEIEHMSGKEVQER